MLNVSNVMIDGNIATLSINSPPVNALGLAVRRSLYDGLEQLRSTDGVDAVIITCAGRTFFAGADISEFGSAIQQPDHRVLFDLIESYPKPVIAAIHGTALGGGLELALACHYRMATPSAQLGLPEVSLGLLPGAGGTQRLPRLIGAKQALDVMVSGRQVSAPEGLALGILDALAPEDDLRGAAIHFVTQLLNDGGKRPRLRDKDSKITQDRDDPELFTNYRQKHARLFHGFKAPENIVRCVEAAVNLPFDEGMNIEQRLFIELEASRESEAQRHLFFAERSCTKVESIARDTPLRPIKKVAVIGAGTMGGGIAMNFASKGIPVTIIENNQEALDRGLSIIRRNYENTARKGRITQAVVEECMATITPSLSFQSIADADLIIEAIFEDIDLKIDLFRQIDAIAKADAILASNTSFLDLNAIADATKRPENIVGLHFFSPANVMRLLEVVRGAHTQDDVIATAMQLGKTIGKVSVLSGVCHGFIANRIMLQRSNQAQAMILEGISPQDIDAALVDYGFAMGEFQMLDLVGLDVLNRGITERTVATDLLKLERLGLKKNGGYYDYDDQRKPTPSPVAARVIRELAIANNIPQSPTPAPSDILMRLLCPVVNEGIKLLEEGIALRASDIDVAAVTGYNWPTFTGGPMFWAETIGLDNVLQSLRDNEQRHGTAFTPAPMLVALVDAGEPRFPAR